ncbi:MAG: DEAD/DEAH box helicase [Chloroflexi bacterium]|jgi:DEAD/DEAH box helicase domain-containing protein|nr:DEAD/DEAH box helicase [Chloroflexota bacterium]MBT7080313.1 DEAD/DEAH box helicase [Chloroflexota bacterium]
MDNQDFLNHLKDMSEYQDQIVHIEHISPTRTITGELDTPLHPSLMSAIDGLGLLPLYRHQATAINAVRDGKDVIVATASASGKTLCYNLPVLETILNQKQSRALYLFPTKALAQDQIRTLGNLISGMDVDIDHSTFDGDTPYDQRGEIKRAAHILLSNPDMLHLGILPNHQQWSGFLSRLKYVVIDEAHVYRGVFGSHLSNVMRRLRRICAHYGANPQFILCSATIANPQDHADKLIGLPCELIDNDGSPHGKKDFVFWNPPTIDVHKTKRRSSNSESMFISTELISRGIRTLTFAKTRRLTELIYIYIHKQLSQSAPDLADRIKPYRAGYLPEDRRLIEQQLFNGELLGTVATNALELGIDIGKLDATVLTGYPGSIASTWQQAGRSGRRKGSSISFLIGVDNPLDQYFMQHPDVFFEKSHESALTNQGNPHILDPHLLCAAWELPLKARDSRYFGKRFEEAIEGLVSDDRLRKRTRGWYLSPQIDYPAQDVNIRSSSSDNFVLVDASKDYELLEIIDSAKAFFQIHTGAVYLHQGDTYLITKLDLSNKTAYAEPTKVPYYTQPKDHTDISITKPLHKKHTGGVYVVLGEVEVTTRVLGFKKKRVMSEDLIGEEALDLPPQVFSTIALWFDLPANMSKELARQGLDWAGGLHATEHAAIALLPLFALCDRNDIGGVSTTLHLDTEKPQIFIYDAYPGGIGIAEKGYELIDQLWEVTLQIINDCPCEDGCPSCIQSPKCGNNNQPLDKQAARIILGTLLKS